MAEPDDEGAVADATDFSFDLKSKLNGQIKDLTLMQQSLLFAEFASISYYNEANVKPLVAELGFAQSTYYERDGAQAYIFAGEKDTVVACRGTEPNEWNDIRADANATAAFAETVGKVHSGFKKEVDDLWPELEKALVSNENTLWFTGHSLGGAMATICAGRCFLSHIESEPAGLFTYGSPRVGDKRYINHTKLDHLRWVNNNDIVTRVPPAWLGFRHSGREMYLNNQGKLRDIKGWNRFKDRARGFFGGLKRFKIDHFSDHSIDRYIEYIYLTCEGEQANPAKSEPGVGPKKK